MTSALRNSDGATERTPLLSTTTQETQLTQPDENNSASISKKVAIPARQIAPDLLRGLLMIIMAEDHINVTVKGYPHGTGLGSEDASKQIKGFTKTLGYVMRSISHLCASGFALLLGMGIAFFIASRSTKYEKNGKIRKQGWKSMEYMKHIIQRTGAIILANYIASAMILTQGFWLANIVLIALAIDYLIVGVLAILLMFTIEPILQSLWTKILSEEQSEANRRNEEVESTNTTLDPTPTPSQRAAFHSANFLLLILGAFTLFLTVQVDPKHGNCRSSINSELTGGGDVQAFILEAMSSNNKPPPSKWLIDRNCSNNIGTLIWNLLFYPTNCRGIVSGFPPMAWLPFAIFGLLYGRLLLARTHSAQKRSSSTTKTVQEALHNITLEAILAIIFAGLFVATRLFHFGNLSENCLPNPNSKANPYLNSIKAFFYVVKYPPSPSFAFLTLSGNFALLVFFAITTSSILSPSRLVNALRSDANPLLVFGRQSLFFYVVHLLLASIFAPLIIKTPLAHKIKKGDWDRDSEEYGVGLGFAFFASYALLLVIMYPLCKAYANFKSRQPRNSIWRFF